MYAVNLWMYKMCVNDVIDHWVQNVYYTKWAESEINRIELDSSSREIEKKKTTREITPSTLAESVDSKN